MKNSTIDLLAKAGYAASLYTDKLADEDKAVIRFITNQAEFAADVRACQYNGKKIESQGVWYQDGRVGLRYYNKRGVVDFAQLIDCSDFEGWAFGSKLDYAEAIQQ